MAIIDRIIHLVIAICLILMLYTQYNYVKSDWCSWEIEKVLFTLENIEKELNVR